MRGGAAGSIPSCLTFTIRFICWFRVLLGTATNAVPDIAVSLLLLAMANSKGSIFRQRVDATFVDSACANSSIDQNSSPAHKVPEEVRSVPLEL